MLQQDNPGDFVISTGKSNSILQFLKTALEVLGIEGDAEGFAEVKQELIRPMEINKSVGDSSKARMELGWVPETSFIELVELLVMKELKELEKN
jgi:GDPmannose 4,6-dehydratase